MLFMSIGPGDDPVLMEDVRFSIDGDVVASLFQFKFGIANSFLFDFLFLSWGML